MLCSGNAYLLTVFLQHQIDQDLRSWTLLYADREYQCVHLTSLLYKKECCVTSSFGCQIVSWWVSRCGKCWCGIQDWSQSNSIQLIKYLLFEFPDVFHGFLNSTTYAGSFDTLSIKTSIHQLEEQKVRNNRSQNFKSQNFANNANFPILGKFSKSVGVRNRLEITLMKRALKNKIWAWEVLFVILPLKRALDYSKYWQNYWKKK